MGIRIGKGDQLSARGGSFGAPKGDTFYKEAMADQKRREDESDNSVPEDTEPEEQLEDLAPKEVANEFEAALLREAESIGLSISDDDLMTFVFRSFISKEIPIIKGVLHAVFRTSTGDDLSIINKKVSRAVSDNPSMMQKELQNISTINVFGQTLMKLGKPGALRDLPDAFEEKIRQINAMSPLILNKMSKRYNLLEFLLEYKLRDEVAVKN